MSLDYAKLVSQGRAKAMGVCWSPEELEALLTLERERKLSRVTAADYIRNGIMSVKDYDASLESDFKPLSLPEAQAEADATLKKRGEDAVSKGKGKTHKRDEKI